MKLKKLITIICFSLITQISFGQKTILWKVTDTINNKTSVILGTYHQIGNSFVDSIPEIKENLYKSELAIFESIDDINQVQKIINSREKSLEIKKRLKKKDYTLLLEISKDWKVDIHKLQPIELRVKLQQEFMKIKCTTVQKNDKWDHFDNYVRHLAKGKNINLLGLETDKEQLELINKEYQFPNWKGEKKKISYLLDQLNRNDSDKSKCHFVENYMKYKLDYKLNEGCKSDILKQRNDNWMTILPQLLKKIIVL